MNKLLVILGLLCLLACGAASAAVNTVPAGGTVFIGEQGLDISAAVGNYTTLSFYSGSQTIGTSAPQATIAIGNANNFYVAPADFSGKTGNWYLGNSSTVGIVVLDPSLTITAKDKNSLDVDVTGKAVTSGTPVTFRIESNTNVLKTQRNLTAGIANIKVRSPDGTTYTSLFGDTATSYLLTSLMIDGNPTYWPGTWNTGAKDASGNRYYKAGTYSFWIELVLNQIKDNYNVEGKTFTAQKTVGIASDTLSLQSNVDSVVKGNNFAITITGSPETTYKLFVKNVATGEQAPTITPNQEGIVNYTSATQADVKTSSAGTRTIGFTTNQDTKDKTWTIRVELATKSDEVTVKVQKGQVTIVAAGTNNYYLGDEIKLTGTNTETSTTYLFMTGPNLPSSGGQLTDARKAVTNGSPDTFVQADVLSDNTWSYKWQTEDLNVDSGSYTVYAVSKPRNKDGLSGSQYGTTSVTIRKPLITANMQTLVAAGDEIKVIGNAGASPNVGVALWIMGKNKVIYDTTSVEDDGTFEFVIASGETKDLYPGQYYVVVQHPMYNGKFDTWPSDDMTLVKGTYPADGNTLFKIGGSGSLQGSDAADALKEALDAAANDDIYAPLQFTVANPTINILPIAQKMVGDKFTIRGTTNLALDSDILVEVVSSSFKPENKANASEFSGSTGTVKVVKGESTTLNAWTFECDTSKYKPDEYIVQSSGVTTSAYASTLFTVTPYVAPTPTPTPVPTTVATAVPTTVPTPVPVIQTPTPTPTPEPTKSPGMGALVALGGLGVVGYLVTKKE